MTNKLNHTNKPEHVKLTANMAIVSGIFIVIVSVVMLMSHLQLATSNPLESQALEKLVERADNEPQNQELREEIRQFDLLARKAYFTSRWQVRTGAWLLIIGTIIFIVSLRIHQSLTQAVSIKEQSKSSLVALRITAQNWILGVGVALILAALAASFLVNNHLKMYPKPSGQTLAKNQETASQSDTGENNKEIEVIDIQPANETAPTQNKIAETTQDKQTQKQTKEKQNTTDVNSETEEQEKVKPTKKKSLAFPSKAQIESNFNAFRGPYGNGIVDVKNPPTEWDAKSGKNILWKTKIPVHGYNSPVIWNGKLFVAGGNKEKRVVYCYNRHTGKLIWEHNVTNVPGSPTKPPKTTDDTGLSAPSVTTNGTFAAAIFGNGDLIVLDMNGKTIWSKNMGVPDNHYGHSSSLVLWKENLIIQYDSNDGGKAFALNIANGKEIWQIERKQARISWATPILAKIDGKMQVIMSTNPIVAGYDIETGKKIWSQKCMMGEVGPSPAYGEGLIFAANEYAKLVAIDPANNYKIAWEAMDYLPEVSSPVIYNGFLFIATSYGMLICYDAKTGEILWEQEYANGFYGSPIIAGKLLYITDMDGITHIIEPAREYKVVAQPPIHEKVVTTAAFKDDKIYIRGEEYLYAIGAKK